MRNLTLTALVALGLVGCAPATETYHWKQGGSVALVDRDQFQCRVDGARSVPVNTQIGQTPTYQTPIQTICRPAGTAGSTQCTTTGGEIYGGDVYSYDANAPLRASYVARCMAAKGYQVADIPTCAPKVIPADIAAIAGKGSRAPVEGACAVPLKGGASILLYPNEFK
ncbi:MAG: hypothetical protein ABI459_02985 [Deltaproteobacteria bacterium]